MKTDCQGATVITMKLSQKMRAKARKLQKNPHPMNVVALAGHTQVDPRSECKRSTDTMLA